MQPLAAAGIRCQTARVLDAPRLVCAQCGRESDEQAQGCRASLLSDDDEHPLESDYAETFCPGCWQREFGDE
jgi:hypothetical protein